MIDVRYIEDSLNRKFPSTSKMSVQVFEKPEEHIKEEKPFIYIKHHYLIKETPQEYRTKISHIHYVQMGHQKFIDRLYDLLIMRLDNRIRKEFTSKLKH